MKGKFSLLGLSTIVLLSGFGIGCKQDRPDVAGKLISAFQNSCSGTGRWTDAALAHNHAMTTILKELIDTDPCKPHAATLSSISGLTEQIKGILKDSSFSEYRLAEEKLQELTLALNKAPQNSTLSQALSAEIVNVQVQLAEARAAVRAGSQINGKDSFANATLQLANTMQSMIGQTEGLASCLKASPASALQIATKLMGMAGSFVSPILGAGMAVIGQLIDIAVDFARNSATRDTIWKLYNSQMPLALSCGLEAMTELYCNANDAFDLLEFQASYYPEPDKETEPIWRGLKILGRQLPKLNQWLLTVKNGVLPIDPLEAERQNQVWKKIQKLDEYYRNIYANINYVKNLFDAANGNPNLQNDLLLKTIVSLCTYLAFGDNGGVNPFREKSSDPLNYACWLVLGPTAKCPEHGEYTQLEEYIRQSLLKNTTISGLFTHWDEVYTIVKSQVDLEFAQTVTADPMSLLAAAREGTPDNLSPYEVLTELLDFLKNTLNDDDHTNPQKPELLRHTIAIIQNSLEILDDANPKEASLEKIRRLFEIFSLRHGLQFFDERVTNFVEWDIRSRLRKGDLPKNISDILKSAGGSIRDRLLASGVVNLQLVSNDLNRARSLTQQNIEIFRSYFLSEIGKSIIALSEAAQRAKEPDRGANRPNGQVLGELCTLILSTGADWPKDLPAETWTICSKSVLDSIYPDPKGELSLEFIKLKPQLENQPMQMRMCAFHRFLRAGRLAEIVRASKPKSPIWFSSPGETLWSTEDLLQFVGGYRLTKNFISQ